MKVYKKIAGLTGLALAIAFHSCDYNAVDDIQDDFKLVVSTDFFNTSVNINVSNSNGADTDLGLGEGKTVHVDIMGPNAQDVYFQDGKTTVGADITSTTGNLAFNIDPNITPSESSPVEFTVVFSADGFISTSKSYKITQKGKLLDQVSLVDISSPPTGVGHQSKSSSLMNGAITENVTMEADGAGTGAKLSIPMGTVMKDADGNDLEGDIQIDMVYFNNEEQSSLETFPGGIMADVMDENGEPAEGTFASAGFVAIEISDENGNQASTFSDGALTVEVEISNTTYTADGVAVQAGDELPVWSYDENTGEWTYESTVTVQDNGGTLTASAEVEHLSYWNFDWFYSGFCYNVPISITSSEIAQGTYVYFEADMYKEVDNTYLGSGSFYAQVGQTDYTYRLPLGMSVVLKPSYYNNQYLDVTFEEVTSEICDGNTTVNVSWNNNNYYTTFDVTGICADDDELELKPTYYFNYRDVDANGPWKWGYMVNGIAYLSLDPTHQYEILGTYAGNTYTTTLSINDFLNDPSSVGDFTNLQSSLDESTRTGTITATMVIPAQYCDQIN